MALGRGISIMGRGASVDPAALLERLKLSSELYKSALASPKTPELSWTQGAARLAQAIAAGWERASVTKDMNAATAQKVQDMKGLAAALGSGDQKQIAAAVTSMSDPTSQQMALGLMAQMQQSQNKFSNEMARDQFKSGLTMNQDTHKQGLIGGRQQGLKQFEYGNDPTKAPIASLNQVNQKIAVVQNGMKQIQDPAQQQQLQEALTNLQQTQLSLTNQVAAGKGHIPDLQKQNVNNAYELMQQGTPLHSLPIAPRTAVQSTGMNPLHQETLAQQKLGEAMNAPAMDKIKRMNDEAMTSAHSAAMGEQVLQQIAAAKDPVTGEYNIASGSGRIAITNGKNFINGLFPGAFKNQAQQEAYNKGVGTLTLGGIGEMRKEGVQRVTEREIQYVVPLFTPTMQNSIEGTKAIIEMKIAINPIIQKANMAMANLEQAARNDPNVNLDAGLNEIRNSAAAQAAKVSMNYMNAQLASQGKRIVINPNFDPVSNPIDKYAAVEMTPEEKQNYAVKKALPTVDIGTPQQHVDSAFMNNTGPDAPKKPDEQKNKPKTDENGNPIAQPIAGQPAQPAEEPGILHRLADAISPPSQVQESPGAPKMNVPAVPSQINIPQNAQAMQAPPMPISPQNIPGNAQAMPPQAPPTMAPPPQQDRQQSLPPFLRSPNAQASNMSMGGDQSSALPENINAIPGVQQDAQRKAMIAMILQKMQTQQAMNPPPGMSNSPSPYQMV